MVQAEIHEHLKDVAVGPDENMMRMLFEAEPDPALVEWRKAGNPEHPVLRDADKKSLIEIAKEMAELGKKAQTKKLKREEMTGGCFTISSLGSIGGTAFTPIVNAPEVAILGVSKAQMKPVWDGSAFQPRLMMPLSLSYDHRAINGADAARFTAFLADVLTDIRRLLL